MTVETEVKQDQTVKTGEIEAGDEKKVDTAAAETDGDKGLQKAEEEFSVDSIMSEKEAKPEEVVSEKGLSPEAQTRINTKIGTAIKEKKIAQEEVKKANAKIAEMETVQAAPKERPVVPLREDFEEGQEYQKAMDKYQDDTNAYNSAVETTKTQTDRDQKHLNENLNRYAINSERMRKKYDDFDDLVNTGPNAFGHLDRIIIESEFAPEISYFLRKNPEQLEAIKGLDSTGATLAIGELSGRFKASQKKTTKAPGALNTIKADTNTEVVDIDKIKDPNAWYQAQQKKRFEEAKT